MNAGTCWGKNTIDPGGRSVEKAPGNDFNFKKKNFNSRSVVQENFYFQYLQLNGASNL
jgi:hypothetical protein